jgi:hypothetical protein
LSGFVHKSFLAIVALKQKTVNAGTALTAKFAKVILALSLPCCVLSVVGQPSVSVASTLWGRFLYVLVITISSFQSVSRILACKIDLTREQNSVVGEIRLAEADARNRLFWSEGDSVDDSDLAVHTHH